MASARVGSPITSCHRSIGSWLAMMVDLTWCLSSTISRKSLLSSSVKGLSPQSSMMSSPHPLEPLEELHVAPVRTGHFQLLGQSRHPDIEGADPLPDGAVAQGAGDVSFADPGRADQDEVVMVPDPLVLAEPEEAVLLDAPPRPEVDILEAGGRVAEVRLGGEDLELPVLPGELLLVDEKRKSFFEARGL